MTTFDERERAFEQMFVNDEELRFRALARRNRLLATWVCEHLDLSGEEADHYTETFVKGSVAGQNDAGLVAIVRADLAAQGTLLSEAEIGAVLVELGAKAAAEIHNERRAS